MTQPESRVGTVTLQQHGPIALLTLSRPNALNALTWTMYQQLEEHLRHIEQDTTIRVVVMRGEGKAFAAGTDIEQFQGFTRADGIAYEREMEAIIERLYMLPRPVLAAIHGYAVGAGVILASACDLRYATPSSRFGVPVARTLGNGLSIRNYKHITDAFGTMRAKEMLFTARLLDAEEALDCQFLTAIVEENRLLEHVMGIAQEMCELAPLTLWSVKEAHRRLSDAESFPPFEDVLVRIYESKDFAEGVRAHIQKRKPLWTGK
jgi:enoyl-CoA hydratase/carnithine racemase